MDYVKLGTTTGLEVSPIAIGAMTYGEPGRGHPVWSLGEEDSRLLIKQQIDDAVASLTIELSDEESARSRRPTRRATTSRASPTTPTPQARGILRRHRPTQAIRN